MKSIPFLQMLTVSLTASFILLCAAQPASAATDWGDNTSATLTSKAWKAADTQADDALAYAERCIATYEGEAKKMQEALTARPVDETKEQTASRWALNDVGTCLLIKGDLLLKRGDKAGAKEAYGKLAKQFADAQCWDPQGWFWAPSDAAKKKLVELELDAQ
jgi:hypothetical protein